MTHKVILKKSNPIFLSYFNVSAAVTLTDTPAWYTVC